MNRTTVNLDALTAEFKQAMQQLYGARLAKVILYGSYARGDFHPESDVDVAVVLTDEEINRLDEIHTISPVAMELSFKYETQVSYVVLAENRLATSQNLFIKNVRKDGVSL